MSLASRGLRDLDSGPERIGDEAERAALRLQGRRVTIKSLLTGVVLTVLALPWP